MLRSITLLLAAIALPQDVDPGLARDLAAFHGRWDQRESLWEGARDEYGLLLQDAAGALARDPAALSLLGPPLMDLASWGLEGRPRPANYLGGQDRMVVRRGARQVLDQMLASSRGPILQKWMADEVLVRRTQPLGRRYLALELCCEGRATPGKLALLTVGRDGSDPIWPAAMDALSLWPDEAVDSFLVSRLGKKAAPGSGRHPYTLLLRRIQESDEPLSPRAIEPLIQRLKVDLLSTDWRDASRAIEVVRGLPTERGVPLLLDALSAWTRREQSGGGSRRILDDVVGELRRISGRSIGRNPKNWITWWIAVRQGRAELAPEESEASREERTAATFFGLRPMTDQVTFVIDRSGSMQTEWGTTEHSRYIEAVDQMMRFLQAGGPATRFNVILFSDEPLSSSPHLVRATAGNLTRARTSLLERVPDGGTNLRPAIELALRLGSRGEVDPERLEADTIIVLCDGETKEGSGWVSPLLERVQEVARVRIHCVLVGVEGDGTLEALSEGTGGDMIRIGG